MTSTDKVDLNDVIDLSVVELYILNYLIKIAGSVVRFSALNEINQNLEKKKLSRSSFYNSLEKLQEKGFVVVQENPHGKGSVVKATELAREAVKQVNLFTIWGTVDVDKHFIEFFEAYGDYFSEGPINNQLFIPSVTPINEVVVEKIAGSSSSISIVAADEDYNRLNLDVSRTRIVDGILKEPDGFFDQVILYRYHPDSSVLSIFGAHLFEEAVRVLKKDGRLIVLVVDVFPSTSNLILESVITDLFKYDFDETQIDQLEQLLKNNDFTVERKIEYRGLIGIIAIK